MMARSWLFVPGDSRRKIEKGFGSEADALILDLEDSISMSDKAVARDLVVETLRTQAGRGRPQLWVRINPLGAEHALADLAAIVGPGLAGIVLPKAEGAHDLVRLDANLEALEALAGVPLGATKVMPIATETPRALFHLSEYGGHRRLAALTWGAEDLPAAIGATINRLEDGRYTDLCRLARSLCLAAAAAADVTAVETVYPTFRDLEGLAVYARLGRQEGFGGMMAIHPDQVTVINAAFTPSADELAWARRVVDAFQGNSGVVALEGRMLDAPHRKQAQRVLDRAAVLRPEA